ncbi:MAG: hypothetical protein JWN01_619 [Patescibacteria group bacterium]|nr:hypothetical protein [Patescibacteria group bacterium]
MTIHVRSTDVTTIPEGKARDFALGYADLVRRCGGKVTSTKTILQSPELLDLGLSVQDVEVLVGQGIHTVVQLTALTEKQVLGLKNVKYPRLLRIKLRLHERGLALAGERPEDFEGSVEALLQRLATPGHLYDLLKSGGFDTLTHILSLEYPDALGYRWWKPVEALLGDRRLTPTSLSRPLSDFDPYFSFEPLGAVGIVNGQDLVALTAAELFASLHEAEQGREPARRSDIGSYVERLETVLKANGHSLRQD